MPHQGLTLPHGSLSEVVPLLFQPPHERKPPVFDSVAQVLLVPLLGRLAAGLLLLLLVLLFLLGCLCLLHVVVDLKVVT